jgi:hypothetical protein
MEDGLRQMDDDGRGRINLNCQKLGMMDRNICISKNFFDKLFLQNKIKYNPKCSVENETQQNRIIEQR